MVGTTQEWVDCMNDLQQCGDDRNLTDLDMRYMEAYFRDPVIFTDPKQKCSEWYPGPQGAVNDVPDCIFCSSVANYCLLPYSVMFYVGVIIAALSLAPCMFCCCLSKPPHLDHEKDMD